MSLEKGYIYSNPNAPQIGRFAIVQSLGPEATRDEVFYWATINERVINSALKAQLKEPYIADEVANPHSPRLVAQQAHKIFKGLEKGALFTHVKLLDIAEGEDAIVGIGKAQYYDGRDEESKKNRPGPPQSNNMVEIRGIYTMPALEDVTPLWNNGLASANVRELLKQFPLNIPTTCADFPYANPGFLPVLEKWGFQGMKDKDKFKPFAGMPKVWLKRYYGPSGNQLISSQEEDSPWLKLAQPIA